MHGIYIPHSDPNKARLFGETLLGSLILDLEVGYHHPYRRHCASHLHKSKKCTALKYVVSLVNTARHATSLCVASYLICRLFGP